MLISKKIGTVLTISGLWWELNPLRSNFDLDALPYELRSNGHLYYAKLFLKLEDYLNERVSKNRL